MKKIELGPVTLQESENLRKILSDLNIVFEASLEETENFMPQVDVFRNAAVSADVFFEIDEKDFINHFEILSPFKRSENNIETANEPSQPADEIESEAQDKQLDQSFFDGYIQRLQSAVSNFRNIKGRSGREEYWSYTMTYIFIFLTSDKGFKAIMPKEFIASADQFTETGGIWMNILILLVMLAHLSVILFFTMAYLTLTVRRFHDIGKTALWVLILFIPILNLYGVFLLCKRSEGTNQYGLPPGDLT